MDFSLKLVVGWMCLEGEQRGDSGMDVPGSSGAPPGHGEPPCGAAAVPEATFLLTFTCHQLLSPFGPGCG